MKVGDSVKPIGNSCGHGYIIGKKYIIHAPYNNGAAAAGWYLRDPDTGAANAGGYIVEADMVIYSLDKKTLEKKIKEMEVEIDKDKKMLEYLQAENKEEVDPNEFFAWYIVEIMESDDPKKKEKISKLLNSVNNRVNIDNVYAR